MEALDTILQVFTNEFRSTETKLQALATIRRIIPVLNPAMIKKVIASANIAMENPGLQVATLELLGNIVFQSQSAIDDDDNSDDDTYSSADHFPTIFEAKK